MNKKEKSQKIISDLNNEYPKVNVTLDFVNPLELLVATILAAQCTDVRVNIVTQDLFKKYKKIEDYANADLSELELDIRSTGFYRNKAKNIKNTCQIILDKFNGVVPKTMEELLTLPGVARKTANIVLSNSYGIIAGIAVDAHTKRLTQRLGLTDQQNPVKIENELMELVPKEHWHKFTYLMVEHGRKVCQAKKPLHDECILKEICPSSTL